MPASPNAGQPTSHVFCSACGKKNAANHAFCSACGTRLVSPHNVPTLPINAHRQPPAASSPQYSDQLWRWFRQRHVALQVIGWLFFWWLLLPLLIWRTTWSPKLKLALSAPFALVVLSALINGPQDQQTGEQSLQPAVVVADMQTRGAVETSASEAASATATARPTAIRRNNAAALPTAVPPAVVSPTEVPPTSIPPTKVPPTPIPPTEVPPTPVPPTATPLIPIAQVTAKGNIRSYPSTESGPVIAKVAAGETITLVSKTPDGAWYEMTTSSGVKGYVSASLLDLAPGVSEIVAAKDAGPPPVVAKPPSKPVAKPAAKPAAQCDPNYSGACIPNVNYDLNCPDVGVKDFYVVGYDKHGFDRDRDGLACES